MKMCWHIKLIMVGFCFGLFLTGANSYTGEAIDRTSLANGTQNLVVIKGKIPVPNGVDSTKAEMEHDGDKIIIKLPKVG